MFTDELEVERKAYSFVEDENSQSILLEMKPTKNYEDANYGLVAVLCTATDDKQWRSDNFFLLRLTDRSDPDFQRVVGYIEVNKSRNDKDEPILVLSGIQPTDTLTSKVPAASLLAKMIKAIQKMACKGGFMQLAIPIEKSMNSNNQDIQIAIEDAGWPTGELPQEVAIGKYEYASEPYKVKTVYWIDVPDSVD
jgi:hypothetical protein